MGVSSVRKAVAGFWWPPASEGVVALVVTAFFFALGSFLGFAASSAASADGAEAMHIYLEHFLSVAQEGQWVYPGVLSFLWESLRWPLVALLFGFSALGLICLPVLSGMRGFVLTFSVGAFVEAYGPNGATAALLILGIPALMSVPAFFLLSAQSFSASCKLASRGSGQGKRDLPYQRAYLFRCILSASFLGISMILDWFLVPTLTGGWASILLG